MQVYEVMFGVIPYGLGLGAILAWSAGVILRRGGAPSVSWAVLGFSLLLSVAEWSNFFLLKSSQFGAGRIPLVNLGLVFGLAIAATAIRLGIRMEERRLDAQGSGTPVGVMAKRATICFLALSLVALAERLLGATGPRSGWGLLAALSVVWVPGGIVWALRPDAGPLLPVVSVAARATFFGLAVTGLVSLAFPWLLRRPVGLGVWIGTAVSTAYLICVAWAGTRLSVRSAILVVATLASLTGTLVLRSL